MTISNPCALSCRVGFAVFGFCLIQPVSAAVWITNFTSVGPGPGGTAGGVWREVTDPMTGAGTDGSFVVGLTTSGEVKPTTDPTQPSRIDESFPWRDLQMGETFNGFTTPAPVALPFHPQVSGDFINIETDGSATSTVTITFGAQIVDPVLSFSDIDEQTTMDLGIPFTVLTSTSNLLQVGNTLTVDNVNSPNTGTNGIIFGEEAAGSIQFSGTFTQLQFSLINVGPDPMLDDDRTGFVVTTETAPVPIPEPSTALLGLAALIVFQGRRRK